MNMKTTVEYHRKKGLALTIYFAMGCLTTLFASPTSDLASPNQEVRDAAAKILRATYVMPPQTNWDYLVNKLTLGTPMTNVLEILGQYTNNIAGGFGSGATETERYRLDDLWILECSHTGRDSSSVLTHLDFIQGLRFVRVDLPSGFTGNWRTYYVNGQKFGEGWYTNGVAEGEGVGFYPDGSKLVVNHVTNGVLEGEEIGYFPSGKIKHSGNYKTNIQVGTWTWYNEDGTVHSKRDYTKP